MKALALIIGNSKYSESDLGTPINDANDLSKKLSSLGFDVETETNINIETFNTITSNFGKKLIDYDIGLFYFAGHGLQIDGHNFLTAINTDFSSEIAAKYSSFTLAKILDYMYKAGNQTNIIILDACRDNPFEKAWNRGLSQNGLAPVYAPRGTIIAFATSPGDTASNGTGRNGLFTSCLLTHLDEKGIPIEEFFKNVRNSVLANSGGKQLTWEHTSLTGKFIFNTGLYAIGGTQYKEESIKDINYPYNFKEGNDIDNIISSLKSHNRYTQSPAILKIPTITAEEAKDKLFILGRNILQTAEGGERRASQYLSDLKGNIIKFCKDGENHVLNGILFEIYFDSKGKFREEGIKSLFLDEISKIDSIPEFEKSFHFIQESLVPFSNYLLYIPGDSKKDININLSLEKVEKNGVVEYIVSDVLASSESLVKKVEGGFLDDLASLEPFKFTSFKEKIASSLFIPIKKLRVITNFGALDDNSNILFSLNKKISKF